MTKQQKRLALVGGVLSAAIAGVLLVLTALGSAVSYFYMPSDLDKLDSAPDGVIRLGGLVETGSVSYASDTAQVRFAVMDEFSRREVTYRGVLPDLFREGQGVIVQGRIASDGALVASEVLAKHDENYMPREVADALKEQGRWRDQSSS